MKVAKSQFKRGVKGIAAKVLILFTLLGFAGFALAETLVVGLYPYVLSMPT